MNREIVLALASASFLVVFAAFLLLKDREARGEAYRALDLRQVETIQQAGTAIHFGNPLGENSPLEWD